jgi:hypothetical protein
MKPLLPDEYQNLALLSIEASDFLVHEITITMTVFATWHGDSSLRSE